MSILKNLIISVYLVLHSGYLLADTSISGFGSIYSGLVTKGDQFLSDYPNTGIYDQDLSFTPDTSFGVQFKTAIDTNSNFILQLITRGANEFHTDIDWAYLSHQFDSYPDFTIKAGRQRLPLYFYSDFFDLGMAYHWVRPPADNYTWQITSYNGLSLHYEVSIDDWDLLLTGYTGREDDNENDLLSYLANGNPVNETWKNIIGFVAEASNESFELRFSIMNSQLDRHVNSISIASDIRQLFYGVSVNYFKNDLSIFSELNRYVRDSDDIAINTYMISFAYNLNHYTPHITYSSFKQSNNVNGGDEEHNTISIGVKKVLSKNAVIKAQLDDTEDLGQITQILGDGQLLTVGIDFTF